MSAARPGLPADVGGAPASRSRSLIVNADGFGFGAGATQGILDAIADGGPITSVSVNANFPEVARVAELVRRFPNVSVGVHLNPVVGAPCLESKAIPTAVGPDGLLWNERFRSLWKAGRIRPEDLEAEFDEQIRRLKELAGDRLTHLDSHQNTHLSYFDLFLRLARRWRIPFIRTNASLIGLESPHPARARLLAYLARPHIAIGHLYRRLQMRRAAKAGLKMADRLVVVGYGGKGNKSVSENWRRVFRNLPKGTYEIYCHPAYPDETLRRWATYYAEPRRRELEILRDPALRAEAEAAGVRLVSFLELAEARP
jgi:predicted glycoside hydrolase/deacetylase ChbG (UPF0249 family)